jgi:hypothetical protein
MLGQDARRAAAQGVPITDGSNRSKSVRRQDRVHRGQSALGSARRAHRRRTLPGHQKLIAFAKAISAIREPRPTKGFFAIFIGPISPICGDGLGGLEARSAGKNGPNSSQRRLRDIRNVKNV